MADYSVKVRGVYRASRRPPVHEVVVVSASSPEDAVNKATALIREKHGCDDTLTSGVDMIDPAGGRGVVSDLAPTRDEAVKRCRAVLDLLAPADREAAVLALMETAQPETAPRRRRIA